MEHLGADAAADLELFESSGVGLRAQATAAAEAMLRQGRTTLTIGLDNLGAVGDAVIAAVIVALRIMREAGGTICLLTHNSEHRHQLALYGLDRALLAAA
jgi:anti-anti-sigma regulatory factor